ncbi:hypothetical protein [Streptomyces sp. NPDC058451]|uniref:hypothetical protein n=1 Tax=Streptomyces sp. NPDC058451 TaxID=3346506 RepID=UPI00365EE109
MTTDERRAKAQQTDRFGVPLAFVANWERTGGVSYESSAKTADLPLSLAPAAVKRAVKAADTAEEALEAADDKAAELWAAYQDVPKQAQREVNAAVARGDEPPSLSALIDERQGKQAAAVIDAISLRNARQVAWAKARDAADSAREKHTDKWRDNVAEHIAAEMSKVRAQMQEAAGVVAEALNAANRLMALADECRAVDRAWIAGRLTASEYKTTPYSTAQRPDIAIPEVFDRDAKHLRQAAGNVISRVQSAPVDIVGELEKRAGWLGSFADGGAFPAALFTPLASHPPVERRWDDD